MEAEKFQSIQDIAILAGVSKSTVSRALNDSPLVEQSTKDRIRALAKSRNFRLRAAARDLSLGSSRTIAFVTHAYSAGECGISDPFSLEIMGGITIGLHELGYDMLVAHVDPDDVEWPGQYLDSGKVAGFILMTSTKKCSHVDLLVKIGAPFIAWGPGRGGYCTVRGDDTRGGSLAAERFAALGKKYPAFIGGPKSESETKDRLEGFETALAGRGIPFARDLALYGDYGDRSAVKAVDEILKREPRVDAIFAASDMMAIAAIRALAAKNRRVPEDVAVIGYDDLMLASFVTPRLTTISQRVPLAGKYLARDLVAYLERGIVTTTIMPMELMVRESA